MAILVGRDKKKQRKYDYADVQNGKRQQRIEVAERKAEQKEQAEAEKAAQEAMQAAKGEKKRGRKPLVKPAEEPAADAEGVVANPEKAEANE